MKKIVALLLIMVFVVFVSGCINQTTITTPEEAADAVQDVSQDIDDLGSDLEEVDVGLNLG